MDIASYKAVTKPVSLDFEGEVINLEVRSHLFTLGLQRKLQAAQENLDATALASFFIEVISSWDLMDDGRVVPLTVEGLEGVPLEILGAIDAGIGAALLPSEEEKRGSSEPSVTPPTDSSEPVEASPNGSETSQSQTVSAAPPTS